MFLYWYTTYMDTAKLTFCGGAGEVTGANFLLAFGSTNVLIDCGTHEQERACGGRDLEPFPYDVAGITALFITHAHQDHIGRVPRLVREGFRGTIYSTPATKGLAKVMFDDALGVMHDEMKRYGCEALYEREDAQRALELWQAREYHAPFEIPDTSEATVEFLDAGHILGSALVKFSRAGRSIVFSGDIGNTPEPLLRDCEAPSGASYLVMESVYGDRVHEDRAGRKEVLRSAIETTRAEGGVLLIPSFSLERTQVLLYEMNDMVESGEMQSIPVYLDSPLAERITEVFRKHPDSFNEAVQARIARGDDPFAFKGLTIIGSPEESRGIYHMKDPKVIIAGAGMSGGGRIRAHEKEYLGSDRTTVLLVGYQAPGSLGRRILDGQKKVRIDGADIEVHARTMFLGGYSGHADREQLLDFVEGAGDGLTRAFIVMGEPRSSLYLAQRIKDFLGTDAVVPVRGQTFDIEW